jgi:hypothetical protein
MVLKIFQIAYKGKGHPVPENGTFPEESHIPISK